MQANPQAKLQANSSEQKQLWQAPELKVVDVAEQTQAGLGPGADGFAGDLVS